MKKIMIALFILGFALFSGCITFRNGTKLPKKKEFNFKQAAIAFSQGSVTELPKILNNELKTDDERVTEAFFALYEKVKISINETVKTEYHLNPDAIDSENRQILLDYFNEEREKSIQGITLGIILDLYGKPAFYEYHKNQNRIIINYMYDYESWLLILSPFWIPGWKSYHYYQFIFNISTEDIYGSPLVFCKKDKFTGKYYDPNIQPAFGEFLDSLVVSAAE
jgi:hypothetical protein